MKKKKRNAKYNERVFQIENGTFTLLVFATNGAMAEKCEAFYKQMAEMIAEKRKISITVATNVIRTRISFLLVRSTFAYNYFWSTESNFGSSY